jgi:hypothetical protein
MKNWKEQTDKQRRLILALRASAKDETLSNWIFTDILNDLLTELAKP